MVGTELERALRHIKPVDPELQMLHDQARIHNQRLGLTSEQIKRLAAADKLRKDLTISIVNEFDREQAAVFRPPTPELKICPRD